MPAPLVLITTSYPEADEGAAAAGSFVADFARELSRHRPVRVVAPGLAEARTGEGALTVTRFRVPRLPLASLVSPDPRRWFDAIAAWRAGARAVRDACEPSRPSHLLALWALPSGAWARSAGGTLGIPYSTWALGSDIWSLGRLPLVRGLLARVLRGAARRYADGEQLRLDVERIGGAPCEFLPSSRVLPAVPRTAHGGALRLAFLGRWHRNKGIDLLLETLHGLDDTDWRAIAQVRINGGGPLEPMVRESVARLVAAGRPVELGGYLDRGGAAALLGWADWLLLPSRIESIPVIFSDAMQAGCGVVAMPTGDLPALLERHPVGQLAAQISAAAFREALRQVLRGARAPDAAALARAAAEFDVAFNAARLLRDLA